HVLTALCLLLFHSPADHRHLHSFPTRRSSDLRPELLAAALIAALALVAGWNAYRYPSGAGYDVAQHREYADMLIHQGAIPAKGTDRKSTRLNSSHQIISYAVFCLKNKKKHK